MNIYLVGGAVRDRLLGLPIRERDFVVVGSSPEHLLQLGYVPVGKDFPVFLHPETKEEYALARTERKQGKGYHGFIVHAAPSITLEEDLARRDLTINAMAEDGKGGLIDPFGGQTDLAAGILRHIGPAFAEDPLRILRVARFAARFNFSVAPETMKMMQEMVHSGEVDALVSERVWKELSRGLMESHPSRMIEVLRGCGALEALLPEVDRLFGVPQSPISHPEGDVGTHLLLCLDQAAALGISLPARFAVLCHDIGKADTPREFWPRHPDHETRGAERIPGLCARLRVPRDCRDTALAVALRHGEVHRAAELSPEELVDLILSTDALRRPERFTDFLDACEADHRGRAGFETTPFPQKAVLEEAFRTLRDLDVSSALQAGGGEPIKDRIHHLRVAAVAGLPTRTKELHG